MTRSTNTLLIIVIALLAAALVIAVALLLQDRPQPDDPDGKRTKTARPPGAGGNIEPLFDTLAS